MAVRLGKYYLHINNGARKYILCVKTFVQCAEMFLPHNIYISGAPKHFYGCANIYLLARIFLGFHANIFVCAEIFWLVRKYLVYPQKIICCAKIFSSRAQTFCLRAEIIRSQPF